MILVSACLVGEACRYDGQIVRSARVLELSRRHGVLALCPERISGLPSPRPAAELVGGLGDDVLDGRARVVLETGEDATEAFVAAARFVLLCARSLGIERALLKARSPSCGAGVVTVRGERRPGNGVTAALLLRNGIEVAACEADGAQSPMADPPSSDEASREGPRWGPARAE